VAGLSCKETKVTFITNKSLVHNHTPGLSQPCPSGGDELFGGERRPEEMNQWHRSEIGLTRDRLVARLGQRRLRQAATARPRWRGRLGLKSGEGRCNAGKQAMEGASLGRRGGVGRLGRWRELAKRGAHRGGGNGGSAECVRTGKKWGLLL
jgi:hypothetical protein